MATTEELVKAAQAGEKCAFAQLVGLYQRAAIITAQAVLGDFDRAQDAAQDGFVTAYTKLNQLHSAAAFGPWLLRIVRFRALHIERAHRTEPLEPSIADAQTEQASDWIQHYEEVVQQLARLTEHERIAIVLRYIDGRSIQEIANTTGQQSSTVKKRLVRALARLRKWMTEVPS
jgi:RNA polymerase sigma-70 factor (ECF subfamily)